MITTSEIERVIEDKGFTAPATEYSEAEKVSGWSEFDEVLDTREYDVEKREYGLNTPIEIPEIGVVRLVETFGGEGQGDHAHIVFELIDSDGTSRLFKKDGYYASYEGTDWDGSLYEVQAVEKTVTVYE